MVKAHMADQTTITLALTGPLADDVRAAAAARGLTPEDYIRQQLAWDIAVANDADDLGVEEDIAAFEDYERTGIGIPGEEVNAWLQSLTTDNPLPRPLPRKLK